MGVDDKRLLDGVVLGRVTFNFSVTTSKYLGFKMEVGMRFRGLDLFATIRLYANY